MIRKYLSTANVFGPAHTLIGEQFGLEESEYQFIMDELKREVMDSIGTRQLLKFYKDHAYASEQGRLPLRHPTLSCSVYFSLEDIKNELNTREHVPNKQEGKVLRRQMAKSGVDLRPNRKKKK